MRRGYVRKSQKKEEVFQKGGVSSRKAAEPGATLAPEKNAVGADRRKTQHAT